MGRDIAPRFGRKWQGSFNPRARMGRDAALLHYR